ncbi:glutathione S-transferase family protein [Sulfuriflexus mobilis]|uniref:glutathione S-transferase family protein n=1 Tax=Sulfuriflexus mobilis TaxID=1811807 RepID=UPI000F81C685|nr:glutathione S-transferase family protein [Sulfuriflexus mobilis]
MSLEVYWISGSPYCWSILLLLKAKGIDFVSKLLSVDKQEHKSADFLELNPRGSVPVIRDGDLVVSESLAILMYLDARFSHEPMFGQDAVAIAKIWQSISEFNSYVVDPMYTMASMIFRNTASDKPDEFENLTTKVTPEFQRLDALLDDTLFLAGETITAADIVAYPRFAHFLLAITEPEAQPLARQFLPFKDHYPSISRWMGRIERLPGFQATFPPHWRELSASAC